uniref:Uncharacterized protein n=1 Tax=Romanomermis culicivorax TaxID=13658 RepID=A0A915HZ20_ROMCU
MIKKEEKVIIRTNGMKNFCKYKNFFFKSAVNKKSWVRACLRTLNHCTLSLTTIAYHLPDPAQISGTNRHQDIIFAYRVYAPRTADVGFDTFRAIGLKFVILAYHFDFGCNGLKQRRFLGEFDMMQRTNSKSLMITLFNHFKTSLLENAPMGQKKRCAAD